MIKIYAIKYAQFFLENSNIWSFEI